MSRQPYQPVEDIPDIERMFLDAPDTDAVMHRIMRSTRFALKNPKNLRTRSVYQKQISEVIDEQLIMFGITHASIRELISAVVKNDYYPLVGDALSLCREQVEKIFTITTLLDNPTRGFRQFVRNKFKTDYLDYLLQLEEQGENERFSEHLNQTIPETLRKMKRPSFTKGNPKIFISAHAERVLNFDWNNPGSKNPAWFKPGKYGNSIQRYVRNYFDFPTPGQAAAKITNPLLRRFLFRWHKEYAFLSQYTHIRVGKLRFAGMHREKGMWVQEGIKNYGLTHAVRSIAVSYSATATACALILNKVFNDNGAKAEVKELWQLLVGYSLFSKALWQMYVEELMD